MAKTTGKTGKNLQPLRLAAEHADATDAARYALTSASHAITRPFRQATFPAMPAPAAPSSKIIAPSKHEAGVRLRRDAGLRCFQTAATFQNPF